MKFYVEGKEVELMGIAGKLRKIISSNGMTKLLKKEQRGVIVQLLGSYCNVALGFCQIRDARVPTPP